LAPLRTARRSEAQQLQLLLGSPGARAAAIRDSDGEGGGPLGEPHRETRAVWLVGRRLWRERACLPERRAVPDQTARGITDQAAALAAAGGLRQRRSEHALECSAARVAASWPSAGD